MMCFQHQNWPCVFMPGFPFESPTQRRKRVKPQKCVYPSVWVEEDVKRSGGEAGLRAIIHKRNPARAIFSFSSERQPLCQGPGRAPLLLGRVSTGHSGGLSPGALAMSCSLRYFFCLPIMLSLLCALVG